MDELSQPRFARNDQVRYVGETDAEEANVLLTEGMVGRVVQGPELRHLARDGSQHVGYLVAFGEAGRWVPEARLEKR